MAVGLLGNAQRKEGKQDMTFEGYAKTNPLKYHAFFAGWENISKKTLLISVIPSPARNLFFVILRPGRTMGERNALFLMNKEDTML